MTNPNQNFKKQLKSREIYKSGNMFNFTKDPEDPDQPSLT